MAQVSVSPVNGFINFCPDGVFFDSVAAENALAYVEVSGSLPVAIVQIGQHSHLRADISDFLHTHSADDLLSLPSHSHSISSITGFYPDYTVGWSGAGAYDIFLTLPNINYIQRFEGFRISPSLVHVPFVGGNYTSGKIALLSGGSYVLSAVYWQFDSTNLRLTFPAGSWLNANGYFYRVRFSYS